MRRGIAFGCRTCQSCRLASVNDTAAVLGILSRRSLLSGFAAAVSAPIPEVDARQAPVSLLELGCSGDGHSDDTVALRKAFDLGIPLTGEGRWYGVRSLRVTSGIDLEDVNLRAIAPKPMGALLDVTGPASVRLAQLERVNLRWVGGRDRCCWAWFAYRHLIRLYGEGQGELR